MTENNFQAVIDRVQQAFRPERAVGVDATVQFHITGDQGGDYAAVIKDQKLSINQGTLPNPRLTITANMQDMQNMFQGKLNPMQAYMQGKIQAKGDLSLAMKLAELFKI